MTYDESSYQDMEIVKLRSFVSVAEHGTFSRAARALNVTQSTVSLHVQALEEELGTRLVERLPRRSLLTDDGRQLQVAAVELIGLHDQATSTFAERRRSGAGRVRVAATHSIVMYYLPERLQDFLQRWPEVEVSVVPARRDEMVAMVDQRQCDFAMVAAGPLPESLRYIEILQADIVLITPLHHPLTWLGRRKLTLADVARHKLVVYPDGAIRRAVDHAFHSRKLRYDVAMTTAGADMVKRYVEVGLGVGFVSRLSLRAEDEQRLYVINMHSFIPPRHYGLLLPRSPLSKAAGRLLHALAPGVV